MNLLDLILATLLALPVWKEDTQEVDRPARLGVIAACVESAVQHATCTEGFTADDCVAIWTRPPEELAAGLVAIGTLETHFSARIHAGHCKRTECHGARSPWQLEHTQLVEPEWDHMVGTGYDATCTAAWAAAKVLARGWARCRTHEGAAAMYATGKGCKWAGARARARTWDYVLYRWSHA